MRIRIRHETHYAYGQPLHRLVQYLRMTPRDSARQTVRRWKVTTPGNLVAWTDHLGNLCHTLVLDSPEKTVSITAEGEVETVDTGGTVPAKHSTLPVPVYLRQTVFTRPDAALLDLAESFRPAMAADRLSVLHDLMRAVHAAIRYTEGATHVHTTAAEALRDGAGVCQDHAHVFISCCRALGVPARYVGGYLVSSDDEEQHAAGHAWASALVPDLGWVSFDAANGVSATGRYVAAAIGHDYADASPVRGLRQGGGTETMDVVIRLSVTQ